MPSDRPDPILGLDAYRLIYQVVHANFISDTLKRVWHPRRCTLKCDKCGYTSFDHNLVCPACNKDLGSVRHRMGIRYMPPEMTFDEFFSGSSGTYQTAAPPKEPEAELDFGAGDEDFEFTLDD